MKLTPAFRHYSDVEVCCGLDNVVVHTHRIFLSALSPFLREVLLTQELAAGDDILLHLPDVSSSKSGSRCYETNPKEWFFIMRHLFFSNTHRDNAN
jgi:hypothetical protein